ncbi:hypothetical protein NO1_2091 [Candidatus Termititenax aidoneus]|uniref:Uncharacterized protein n=1 Tax=Termititenax aidoneus TaxID=2218524 RepID=A0A388TEP4_TERA1|nr:hypothetical protein NO1_2091 [Candidatus Termititenax aidoneus]
MASTAGLTTADVTEGTPPKSLIEMQLDAYAAKVRYETLEEIQAERIKDKEAQIQRQWWLNIALIIALGYAAGK